jgi:carbon-monoxide dehydrogenase small subunit
MLATGYDIVTRLPDADEARIREELSGNLCRCTGYMGIVAAIRAVLAEGPHRIPAAPARAPAIGAAILNGTVAPDPAGSAPGAAAPTGTAADTPPALPATRPAPLTDGTRLHRAVDLDLPADQVWPVLRDIHAVAACLPGAAIEEVDPEGRVIGSYTTRIGPMKASFRGTAYVDYDDAAHSGTVSGSGGDGSSRSRAQGQIGFTLADRDAPGCRLDVDMLYKIGGPLAQIGRPGIVAAVVDQILETFTANLVARAQGHDEVSAPAAAPGTLALLFGVIRRIVRLPKRG